MGEIGIPGREVTWKEQILEVASINSFSWTTRGDGGRMSRL
jgi:hypothetical protein